MKSLILAGGLGTRLQPLVGDTPKPMVPVAGTPVLEHQIRALRDHGLAEIILCVGHGADVIVEHFGSGESLGVRIDYAREERLLGTAGAMLNARHLLGGESTFLAMNGDTLLPDLDYTSLLEQHLARALARETTAGTLVVVHPPDRGAYGVVELEGHRVLRFREKAGIVGAGVFISGGAYALQQTIFDFIEEGRPTSIEFEVFPRILAEGLELQAHAYSGFFGDIGTPAGYDRVQSFMEQREKDWGKES